MGVGDTLGEQVPFPGHSGFMASQGAMCSGGGGWGVRVMVPGRRGHWLQERLPLDSQSSTCLCFRPTRFEIATVIEMGASAAEPSLVGLARGGGRGSPGAPCLLPSVAPLSPEA